MEHVVSLELDDEGEAILLRLLESGRYADAEQVLIAGLTLPEEHEVRLESLRSALNKGEGSGKSAPLDVEWFLAEKRAARIQ